MEVKPVGVTKRSFAVIADIAFIFIAATIFTIFFNYTPIPLMGSPEDALVAMANNLFGYIVLVSAFAMVPLLMEMLLGSSPGKLILGIKIATPDGAPAPIESLLKRAALKGAPVLLTVTAALTGLTQLNTLSALIGFTLTLGCLLALGTSRQTLHDIFADTAVYRRKDIQTRRESGSEASIHNALA
jgi:uncharacterized RDD family membrane protein YckC